MCLNCILPGKLTKIGYFLPFDGGGVFSLHDPLEKKKSHWKTPRLELLSEHPCHF